MFLRKKFVNGTPYFSIVENVRCGAKVKQKTVRSLGTTEKAIEILQSDESLKKYLDEIQKYGVVVPKQDSQIEVIPDVVPTHDYDVYFVVIPNDIYSPVEYGSRRLSREIFNSNTDRWSRWVCAIQWFGVIAGNWSLTDSHLWFKACDKFTQFRDSSEPCPILIHHNMRRFWLSSDLDYLIS